MTYKTRLTLIGLLALFIFALVGCGPEKTPSRDYFPILKEGLNQLQAAVLARDTAAVDSLVIPKLRKDNKGADSLFRYVYGPDNSFAFEKFGDYEIVYTHSKARIDCYVMDSTGSQDRPTTLIYELTKEHWLLKSIAPRTKPLHEDDTTAIE